MEQSSFTKQYVGLSEGDTSQKPMNMVKVNMEDILDPNSEENPKNYSYLKLISFDGENLERNTHVIEIKRYLKNNVPVKIGRLSSKKFECEQYLYHAGDNRYDNNIWLMSKVVSRNHAEIWIKDGSLYLRDLGSTSGTFLNNTRLSPSGGGSRPYIVGNNDIIQFGMDYKWKNGEVYKSIIFKVSIQNIICKDLYLANYRLAYFWKALDTLLSTINPNTNLTKNHGPSYFDPEEVSAMECCLCIGSFGPFQALFVSPCSHCYHYKCVMPMLEQNSMFQCPICRQYANLTASVSMKDLNVANERSLIEDKKEDLNANGRNTDLNMNCNTGSNSANSLNEEDPTPTKNISTSSPELFENEEHESSVLENDVGVQKRALLSCRSLKSLNNRLSLFIKKGLA